MESDESKWVAKVHPTTRSMEPDDPLDLNATLVAGDVDLMFRSVVQEYAWMGWGAEPILGLFRDPFYPALNGLWQALGDDETRSRIESILARTGVIHFHATVLVAEPDESDLELDLDLVQIGNGDPDVLLGPFGTAAGSFIGIETLIGGITRRGGNGHVEGV
jgi:hypothetical protein